jgi:putative tryptophan/tyrosine transport system substrate-binding protein
MNRRAFLCGSVLALGAPLAAEAQPTAKAPTVGWLSDGVRAGSQPGLQEAFLQGLRELGYVEGQTVVIERRDAAEKIERLDTLAAELVSYGVNVIVATSGAAALAAKRATTSIPIVIAESGDPVAIGLVASLGRPGGNVTGLSVMDQEITAKRVQLLKEIAPRVSQIAVLYHPPFPATLLTVSEARTAATRLGLAVVPMEVLTPDAFESAFNAVIRQRADALLTPGDPFSHRYQRRIIDLAAKHRLPAAYLLRDAAELGGLMAYGPSLPAMYQRAAVFVDKILKGGQPRDLPIELPTKFELLINLKTAKALGLTIPPSLLARADQVIEVIE